MLKQKQTGSKKLRSKFETLRREKANVRKQHDLYVNNLVGEILQTSIGTLIIRKGQCIPSLKRRGTGIADSEIKQAEEFNGQFTDVFNNKEYTQIPFLSKSAAFMDPFMDDIIVSKQGVTNPFKGLNPSEALGPDDLHPRVLKELATELGPVCAHLFQ